MSTSAPSSPVIQSTHCTETREIAQPIPQKAVTPKQQPQLDDDGSNASEKEVSISVEEVPPQKEEELDESYFSESSSSCSFAAEQQRPPSPTPSEIHIILTQRYGIKVRDFAPRPVVANPKPIEETYQRYLDLRYGHGQVEEVKRTPSPALRFWKGVITKIMN